MRKGFIIVAVGWAVATATVAGFAQTTAQPATTKRATTASTVPTSAPVDQSTPKGALKVLTTALDTGDRKMLLEVFHADTPVEKKMIEATAALAEATAELRGAASKAFGEQASRALGVDPAAVPEAMARVDASAVTIEGDKATVTSPEDQNDKLVLVHRGEKWHVPMSQIAPSADEGNVDKSLRDTAEHVKLLKQLAGEVSAGQYKTPTEARQELDKRIIRMTMPATTGATATAPAATKK